MNITMHFTETNADVEFLWVSVPSNERINGLMATALSVDECTIYGSNAHVMITTVSSKIKSLLAKELNHIYADLTQAKVQLYNKVEIVEIPQVGNNDSFIEKKRSARALETIMIAFVCSRATGDVMSQFFKRWF